MFLLLNRNYSPDLIQCFIFSFIRSYSDEKPGVRQKKSPGVFCLPQSGCLTPWMRRESTFRFLNTECADRVYCAWMAVVSPQDIDMSEFVGFAPLPSTFAETFVWSWSVALFLAVNTTRSKPYLPRSAPRPSPWWIPCKF